MAKKTRPTKPCRAKKADGGRCSKTANAGSTYCASHRCTVHLAKPCPYRRVQGTHLCKKHVGRESIAKRRTLKKIPKAIKKKAPKAIKKKSTPRELVEWRFCREEDYWGVCWLEEGRGFKIHVFGGRLGQPKWDRYETFKTREAVGAKVQILIGEKLEEGFQRTLKTTWTLSGGAKRWKESAKNRAAREKKAFKKGAVVESVDDEQRQKMRRHHSDLIEALVAAFDKEGGFAGLDTVSREALCEALFEGFVYQEPGYKIPRDLYMLTSAGNKGVRAALSRYFKQASKTAKQIGLNTPAQRLAAFKDESVSYEGWDYESFFGGLNVKPK